MESSLHFHGVKLKASSQNPRFTSPSSSSFENLNFRASICFHQCRRCNDFSLSISSNYKRSFAVNCRGVSKASYNPELAAIHDLNFSHQSEHQSTLSSSIEMMNKSEPLNLPKVLLLRPSPVFAHLESEFSRHFNFIKAYTSPLPLPEFLAAANSAGVTALLAGGLFPITAVDVLDHIPELRCIVTTTAGLNYIDLAECRSRGIAVASAGDAFSDDCAEYAVSLLIDVLRKVSSGDGFVRRGDWALQGPYGLGRGLKGKKVGIIGLGSIGGRIAKRLEAFGCIILYNSRKQKPSVSYPYYADVGKLATNSDVLVISCALTDQTRHIINKEVMLALGKEGLIINIARGSIIKEKELVTCLVEGNITGAGLDVFEKEPYVPKELFSMDNVVLSPHAAFLTHESFRDVFELAKANLLAFFSNKPLLSPVVDI